MTDRKTLQRIFVVDDDEAILEALAFCLEDEGYTVKAVRKAEKVVETVQEFDPHIILLDLFLSSQDGKEIALALQADKRTDGVPIIMFSAHPSAYEEAEKLGIAGFLPKPFDTNELFQVIKKHILVPS